MIIITIIHVAVIVVCLSLILLILLQARGGGGIGGIFGGLESSGFRTRRGVEQTVFRLTIILAIMFVAISALSAMLGS
ncbi:preprotein translocase subunit SecG [Dehalococcoidia bacterium]|nr:preprotein translocase subunit SecG [Dehalococcoidia bacterium]